MNCWWASTTTASTITTTTTASTTTFSTTLLKWWRCLLHYSLNSSLTSWCFFDRTAPRIEFFLNCFSFCFKIFFTSRTFLWWWWRFTTSTFWFTNSSSMWLHIRFGGRLCSSLWWSTCRRTSSWRSTSTRWWTSWWCS